MEYSRIHVMYNMTDKKQVKTKLRWQDIKMVSHSNSID